jgi:uncharacterized membrane protein YfcA
LRGSTGFGGAVGMPLLALVIPMKVLVPVWTLLGFASSLAVLGRERRHVALREFVAFVPWCLAGVAVGLYFFAQLDARSLARGLGVLVLLYALTAFLSTVRGRTASSRFSLIPPIAATLSGAVGTAFGTMASVFFAMYLDARAVAKDAFRATISAMLLTLSAVRAVGYFAVGDFTQDAWIAFALALPFMLLGVYIGDRVQLNISETAFKRLVCAMLILCSLPLLLK